MCLGAPVRRLARITAQDLYECYGDGYINSFWNIGLNEPSQKQTNNVPTPQAEVRKKVQLYTIPRGSASGNNLAIL